MSTPFPSIDHAVRWAAHVLAHSVVSATSAYRLGQRGGSVGELTQWDRHAQAAQIIGIVELHCDAFEREYVAACAGNHSARERMITWMIAQMPTGVHRRRAIQRVWLEHCGAPVRVQALCAELGIGRQEARAWRARMWQPLQMLREGVWQKLEGPMIEHGIVEYRG